MMPMRPSSDGDLGHPSRFAAISHVRLRAYTRVTTGRNTKNAKLCDRSPRRHGPLSSGEDGREGQSSRRWIVTPYAASPAHEVQNRGDDRDHDQHMDEPGRDVKGHQA